MVVDPVAPLAAEEFSVWLGQEMEQSHATVVVFTTLPSWIACNNALSWSALMAPRPSMSMPFSVNSFSASLRDMPFSSSGALGSKLEVSFPS